MKLIQKFAFFLLVISAVTLYSSTAISATPYYAIVDAGSSGSRLYLYHVDTRVQTSPQITQIADGGSKTKPGISTQLGSCAAYTAPLFTSLNTYLRSNHIQQSDVTVSLQATAGMRVVSPVEQNTCYGDVRRQLSSTLPEAMIGPIRGRISVDGR